VYKIKYNSLNTSGKEVTGLVWKKKEKLQGNQKLFYFCPESSPHTWIHLLKCLKILQNSQLKLPEEQWSVKPSCFS
jgi:hypothetical protein